MSNSHEPSYYEIALTNRQVVVAFVILLACLLTAFFSGVWVGRGSAERDGEAVVRSSPPPEPRPEGTSLEELEFFDRGDRDRRNGRDARASGGQAAPGAAEAPAGEERPTTLAEDLDARAGRQPPAAPGDAQAAAEPPAPAPAPAAPPVAVPPQAAPAPAAPAPADRRAERADPAERDTAEPAAGSVVIQVFATSEREEAARVRNRLQRGGQQAFLSPVTVDGRTMFRVRIGPFATREDAERVAQSVQKTYRLDTWVTQ